jgi:hypothetical protein
MKKHMIISLTDIRKSNNQMINRNEQGENPCPQYVSFSYPSNGSTQSWLNDGTLFESNIKTFNRQVKLHIPISLGSLIGKFESKKRTLSQYVKENLFRLSLTFNKLSTQMN